MLELDHIFVCVPNERELDNFLANSSLNLSARRVHRGQGTANRCAFFDNAYLEFLLRNNDEDLQSESLQSVSLWERMQWRNTGASPFGIAFRFVSNQHDFPVETRPYYAPFLPNGVSIPIATPLNSIQEPLIFFSLVTQKPIEKFALNPSYLEHLGSRHLLTKIEIKLPYSNISEQLLWFYQEELISISQGESHHAELVLNNGREEQSFDFRPVLPLSIRW